MKRGDIVIVDLPVPSGPSGREQIGKRPALLIHSDETNNQISVLMIIPFTSQLSAQRFPYSIMIQPSPSNGLSVPSVLMVFQLRAIDRSRIVNVIGHLDDETMALVEQKLRNLLSL